MITLTSVLLLVSAPPPTLLDAGDRPRVQQHLQNVEHILRSRDVAALTPAQRANRAHVLRLLNAYWLGGEFPVNRDYPGRALPHFIDANGIACAVGQLMIDTGYEALAARIAATDNLVRLPVVDAEVAAWAERFGLTMPECKEIQPTYGECDECQWAGGEPVCGEDGLIYQNQSCLNCYGVAACPEDGDPVCGTTDQRTYPNVCQALCAGNTVTEPGTCQTPEAPADTVPPDEAMPVEQVPEIQPETTAEQVPDTQPGTAVAETASDVTNATTTPDVSATQSGAEPELKSGGTLSGCSAGSRGAELAGVVLATWFLVRRHRSDARRHGSYARPV